MSETKPDVPREPTSASLREAHGLRVNPCRGGAGHAISVEVAAVDGAMLPSQRHCTACLALALDSSRRAALGQAADTLKAKADSLFAWMEKQEIGTAKRTELSLRAGELYTAEAAIRALMEGE